MPVSVYLGLIGNPEQRQRVQAAVQELLKDRPENWQVQIVGSQTTSQWEMMVDGPNNSQWSELIGEEDWGTGGGDPRVKVIRNLLERVLRQYDE